MREFFLDILKDLKDIYGCNQIHWLMQECATQEEFNKKKNFIIDSLVTVSKRFDYIPDEVQQKYIRKMLIEDQNYESLNTRVVWKWLDMHKVNHITHSHFDEDALTQYEPASPERADYWAEEWKKQLAMIGQPVPKVTTEEIERKDPILKGLVSAPKPPVVERDPREEKIRQYVLANVPKWIMSPPKHFYDIEGVQVPGDDIDEARSIYLSATL